MKEEDLYKPLCAFFTQQKFVVRSEVHNCDMIAEKDGVIVAVELKKSMTLMLLQQAVKRQKIADIVFMAIPKPKNFALTKKWKNLFHLVRRLELGLLFVSDSSKEGFVEVAIEPVPFNRNKSIRYNNKKREALIQEIRNRSRDCNIGGSRGKKLVTAYREKALFIAFLLQKEGELTAKQLKKYGTDRKKTYSILYTNVYGWFTKKAKGLYSVNKQGIEALNIYRDLADLFQSKITR